MDNEFNPLTPDAGDVYYQSWSGAADPFGWHTGTAINALLIPPYLVLKAIDGDESDGIVTTRSGHWGRWRGTMPADHFTEVGQVAGLIGHFDYEGFYEDVAVELTA